MSRSKSTSVSPVAIDAKLVKSILPARDPGAHKWGVGGVLIIGGSPGYIGAPALAAMGAGRSGAGIVSIASPRSALGAIASIVPEATFMPLPEGDLGAGGERAAERIREKLERYLALVVGPGLGEDEYADAIMQGLTGAAIAPRATSSLGFSVGRAATTTQSESSSMTILGGSIPAVIDADGLNWLAGQEDWPSRFAPNSLVLTPHIGEMARLTGLETSEIAAESAGVAARFAAEWQQTIVLKGGPTVVASGDQVRVATASPAALATAGSGDVLAGSIGALLAQGCSPIDAATAAIFLGVEAAERLTKRFSALGVIATDLPMAIAESIAELG